MKGDKRMLKIRRIWKRKFCYRAAVVMAILSMLHPISVAGQEKAGQGVNGDLAVGTEAEEVITENESQRYPLLPEITDGSPEDYVVLFSSETASYEVEKGDTLWKIARDYYGMGKEWNRIKEVNTDVIENASLIYPGMELSIPKAYYIRKQADTEGGFWSDACSYDVPAYWIFGRPNWEVCLEYSYWPETGDAKVYTHVTENRMFPEGIGEHWEDMQHQIEDCAKKTEGVSFSVPEFSRYRKEDGSELLFYSFICTAGEEKIQYAVAYVPGKRYLAEFIGCCPISGEEVAASYAIGEITRYMAASYVETGEEKIWDSLKYRPYLGHENWPFEDLHNPFAMAAEIYAPETEQDFTGEDREITFVSREWEELLRNMTCYHYDMTDEEWEEFSDRPVRASDLAWITEVTFKESPIPGRDVVSVNSLSLKEADCAKYNLTTLEDIAVLPNLEKITLETGSASDYEALGECLSLQEISIASAKQMEEIEWLIKLPQLKSLTLQVSMFPHLNEIGYEKEGGTTFHKEETTEEKEKKSKSVMTPEEVLAKCVSLEYLELEYPDMTDFEFLNELPDLYAFRIDGEEEDSEAAKARRACFGEDVYPQIRCLVVDGKWLRNPG